MVITILNMRKCIEFFKEAMSILHNFLKSAYADSMTWLVGILYMYLCKYVTM